MPIINSCYQAPPLWVRGKHFETIIPALFRKVEGVIYQRERLYTADKDFIDLDWSKVGSKKVAIIAHGAEGDTQKPYILGMVKELNAEGWDTLSWNLKGCSGEINQQKGFYHAASSEDLSHVVNFVVGTKKYKEVALIGFSIGGCITLKYLGERKGALSRKISKAVALSAPCDLYACSQNLSNGVNRLYSSYFLMTLKVKIQKKLKLYPEILESIEWSKIDNFLEFEDYVTTPLLGYDDAFECYEKCSPKKMINDISIPTLIINAKNDPFMNKECFPIEECHKSSKVFLEIPSYGGHIGFMKDSLHGRYFSEERTTQFLNER